MSKLNITVEKVFCKYCKKPLIDGKCKLTDCNWDEILKYNYENNVQQMIGESYVVIMYEQNAILREYDTKNGFHTDESYHKNVYEDMTWSFNQSEYKLDNGNIIVYFETVSRQIDFFPFIPTSRQEKRFAKINEINELTESLARKKKELKEL